LGYLLDSEGKFSLEKREKKKETLNKLGGLPALSSSIS
jgi:hypothetical protein